MSTPERSVGRLYGMLVQPKTVRVLALAKYSELQLEYQETNWVKGETRTPEYLAKFPMGKVPAFQDSDGFCLTESRAILRYVAGFASTPGLQGSDPQSAALVDAWINWVDDEIFNNSLVLRRTALGLQPYFKPSEKASFDNIYHALSHLNQHLQTATFLVGHRVSLADIAVTSGLRSLYAAVLGPEIRNRYPNVLRYLDTMMHQPDFGDIFTKDFALAKETLNCAPAKK